MTSSEAVTPELTLTFFGPFQVLVQGQPLPRLRSRKALWLLALLVLRQDRPAERAWLAETLWADAPLPQALGNLRVLLSELRRALGSQGDRVQSPNRDRLSFDLTGAEVDVRTFDVAASGSNLSALKQAVALYRGPLLEGWTEEWVFPERTAREQSCLRALERLADAAIEEGDQETAIACYRQAASLAPLWDAARRGWMAALANSGDTNAALQVYRDFLELRRRDSHDAPESETTALYNRLRTSVRAKTVTPLADAGGKVPQVRGALPHPSTVLVGREEECLEVAGRLRRARLVTLVGMGGIGKTRLGIAVASQVGREYPDGAWMVPLESLSDGEQVTGQLASVLGLREEKERTPLENITDYLQNKKLLIVLDNCEHLIDSCTPVVESVLRACAGVRVLATSREALGITGEIVWAVPPLPVPDPANLVFTSDTFLPLLADYEGIALFMARAEAAQEGFAMTRSNAPVIAQICARLEGIPLALELTASRLKGSSPEQILERLTDYVATQVETHSALPFRQQTLRSTLDWSFDLLSVPEKILLPRLSVFAGGWTLEAAEAICSGDGIEAVGILDLLISLVDKSLVQFEEGESGGRYRLLEIVRQYATERLYESGETELMRFQHRAYLLAFAEEADSHMASPNQEQWLNRLDAEYDNLRATLNWQDNSDESIDSALGITGALWRYWDHRGYCSEGIQFIRNAQEGVGEDVATARRAKSFTGLGALLLRQGKFAESRAAHQQCLRIVRQMEAKPRIAASLSNQGTVAWAQGDYAAAESLLEESLSIHRELGNVGGISMTLRSLGILARARSDFHLSRRYAEEALGLCKDSGDTVSLAFLMEDIGSLALLLGDPVKAQIHLEESLNLRQQAKYRYGIALSVGNLATLEHYHGRDVRATALCEECLTIFRELGDMQGIGMTLNNLGIFATEQGDFDKAQSFLDESLVLLRQVGDRDGTALALYTLGTLAKEKRDYARAQNRYRESLAVRHGLGNKLGLTECLDGIAAVLLAQSHPQSAVTFWGISEKLREEMTSPRFPRHQRRYEVLRDQARSILGEEAFNACWETGRAVAWGHILTLPIPT